MSSVTQNNIEFIRLDGKENIYRITKDTYKHWLTLTLDNNYTFFAKQDASGKFVGYEDTFNKEHLVSELKYTGKYKDLVPSGYQYYNGANGIKYNKAVSRITCIFISKAGNRMSIEDLHHQSGLVLRWLITHDFTVECDKSYFICTSRYI